MLRRLPIFVAVGLLIFVSGCASRVLVIDSQADIIRLTKPTKAKGAAIWREGQWQTVGTVEIPAGWYCGPGPLPE